MSAPHMPTDSSPQPPPGGDGGGGPVPVQTDAAAITAAVVQATEARMAFMRQQMKAAGHTPPGV